MSPVLDIDPEKRERIFSAATELFAHFGFKKTSVSDIAEKAGVGKGTVYLVATNKEELFVQVVTREVEAYMEHASSLFDATRPADTLLLECSLHMFGWYEERPLVKELLLGNYEESFPVWTDQLDELRARGRAVVMRILRLGVDQEIFRKDLDVEAVARILQDISVIGFLMGYREKRSLAQQIAVGATALDLLLKGLLVR
jgi:AcrR family transcriptional regulator